MKKQKGITLIALVITIVVLLILAGVSISMLTGENGIITQAQQAKEKTEIGEEKEAITVAYSSCKTTNLGGEVSDQQLEEELIRDGKDVTVTKEESNLIVTYNTSKRVYTIYQNGKIEEAEQSDISIKLTLTHNNVELNADELINVREVTNENVPIPGGYYYAGGTKDTGVVISDIDGDDLDNKAGGNQFVWVPVNQNQVLTLKVESKEDITGITLTHPDGTQESITASGKTYNGQITMTKNGVYEVEVTTATSSKIASKRITSLYAQDPEMDVIWNINDFKNNATEKYNTKTELLEVKSYDTIEDLLKGEGMPSFGQYMAAKNIYVVEAENDLKKLVRTMMGSMYVDNNQNKESVEKYGGYYIARFEAGDGDAVSERTADSRNTHTVVSKKGAYVYNYVDWETSRTLSSTLTTNYVTAQLITGAGWDRTLNWIIETKGKTENEVIYDSSSWGNYWNSTGNAAENSGEGNINYTTGRNEYWKANNIYDLAGNTAEWTQEEGFTKGADFATGGSNFSAGTNLPEDSTNQCFWISFRQQLYIRTDVVIG